MLQAVRCLIVNVSFVSRGISLETKEKQKSIVETGYKPISDFRKQPVDISRWQAPRDLKHLSNRCKDGQDMSCCHDV